VSQPTPPAQDAVRADIARVGASLFQRGLVHSTAGNISVRLAADQGGGFLITPTDACLGFLDPAQLAWVSGDGTALGGARASKTLTLHRRIYASVPEARCVLHTHSTHLLALSMQGVWRSSDILPPLTPYQLMKVGHVPLIPYYKPGDVASADAVEHVIARYADQGLPLHAVMLSRLGPNVWHDSPAQAMATLEELEETARLSLLTQTTPLEEKSIEELRQTFGAHW
jgi:ribulose-5-phosphate 4-epimerase/fuculose-1-phosphate aldolase